MIKRSQYVCGKVTHEEYYGQFVTESVISTVLSRFGLDKLAIQFELDEHLNGIPLTSWDNTPLFIDMGSLEACDEFLTPAVKVCILKEAARQAIARAKK